VSDGLSYKNNLCICFLLSPRSTLTGKRKKRSEKTHATNSHRSPLLLLCPPPLTHPPELDFEPIPLPRPASDHPRRPPKPPSSPTVLSAAVPSFPAPQFIHHESLAAQLLATRRGRRGSGGTTPAGLRWRCAGSGRPLLPQYDGLRSPPSDRGRRPILADARVPPPRKHAHVAGFLAGTRVQVRGAPSCSPACVPHVAEIVWCRYQHAGESQPTT
jgi:hypothetical protein